MKTKTILFFVCFLLFFNNCYAQHIKQPCASGTFYPSSVKILAERIKQFLDWAEVEQDGKDVLALISPHAGYDYSGSVAAYGFKAIKGRPIRTVIIIGPSHFVAFEGISVYPHGFWQTPLGNVPVDTELANNLIESSDKISFYEPAFEKEHAIEVQIPFLQMVLDNFKIVPIAIGSPAYENCQILSQALTRLTAQRKDVLIIASTDMSHYHTYTQANQIDNFTIEELKRFDPQSLYQDLTSGKSELCGQAAVITALLTAQAQGADQIKILKYANSGDTATEKGRVVGYLSAVIYAQAATDAVTNPVQSGEAQMAKQVNSLLDQAQKQRLLEIARKTIELYITDKKVLDVTEADPALLKKMGAFVTIHQQGALRGCIGSIIGQQPLYLTVRDMAIEAAVHDPRFSAVRADELSDIDLEISVLSEPEKVSDPSKIEMGVHGVIVKKGFASGVFLPQVADETGWDREEFLTNLCAHKAGLSPDAWKDKNTQLYSFTAQVFGEK